MDCSAVVTAWFVTAADVAAVINSHPRADRGFGRKLLAQLNPSWPITPIGQFSMNRSVPTSTGEFYIAGFPGVGIIQTVVEDARSVAHLPDFLLTALPAADVYISTVNESSGLGGFAHFSGGVLRRSFVAIPDRIFEDEGVPEPFELPFWSQERADGGILLPFDPVELAVASQQGWLGVDVSVEGPPINIVAFAVDGRPEPKQVPLVARPVAPVDTGSEALEPDYEDLSIDAEAEMTARMRDTAARASDVGRTLLSGMSDAAKSAAHSARERLRRIDRC